MSSIRWTFDFCLLYIFIAVSPNYTLLTHVFGCLVGSNLLSVKFVYISQFCCNATSSLIFCFTTYAAFPVLCTLCELKISSL